jgi:hypothetical protein
MDAQDTLEMRRPNPRPENEHDTRATLDTRLVSIDVATGAMSDIQAGPGAKFNPSFLPGDAVGYVRKDLPDAGIYYTGGRKGPKGDVRAAAWSPDWKTYRVPSPPGGGADELAEDVQPEPTVRSDALGNPAVVQCDRRQVRDDRPAAALLHSAPRCRSSTPARTRPTSFIGTRSAT